MVKNIGTKRKRSDAQSWEASHGWQRVDVGDELLMGSDEGGFLELEEFKPPAGTIISGEALGAEEAPTKAQEPSKRTSKGKGETAAAAQTALSGASEGDNAVKAAAKGRGRVKKGKVEDAIDGAMQLEPGQSLDKPFKNAAAGKDSDVAALKAQLAALKEENERLKQGTKQKAPNPNSARSAKLAAKRGKAKEVREAKKAAAKARKLRAAAAAPTSGEDKSSKKRKVESAMAAIVLPVAEAAAPAVAAVPGSGQPGQPRGDVTAWEGHGLGAALLDAISSMGFEQPTPIQQECLLPAIRDRRDLIGAAQTGSGKTLAFGLPILQLLLVEREQRLSVQGAAKDNAAGDSGAAATAEADMQEGAAEGGGKRNCKGGDRGPLRALVLAPTRELAMQVCEHLQAVAKSVGIWVAPIVGGISPAKQARLLSRQPEVVVATPGRLWEMMRGGEPHLADLRQLSFLVLDEADRMVQQGHYQELTNILESLESQRADGRPEDKTATAAPEADDLADEGYAISIGNDADVSELGADRGDPAAEGVLAAGSGELQRSKAPLLQTFVFSATLTLPQKQRKRLRKGGGTGGGATLDSLMDRIAFRGKPKIADLTSERKLADKVEEACVRCSDEERDEHLYYLLAAHPGRTLVFVNAVSAARRVAALLQLLKLPSAALHAGMQQRARLKALSRFKANDNAVLVASDVAARGLDIQGVRCVVHYQIPATVDVYVHRSGRTARANEDGLAVALVTPREAARYIALQQALDRPPPPEFPLDPALLPACRERVRLAVRLDAILRAQKKSSAERTWIQRNAAAAGIDVSDNDDVDEDGDDVSNRGARGGDAPLEAAAGRGKKRRRMAESAGTGDGSSAAEIQQELDALLAQPLQARFSRRFFTGVPSASLAAAARSEENASDGAAGHAGAASQSVGLAQRLSDSRTAAKEKYGGGAQPKPKGGAKGKMKVQSKAEMQAAALAAALEKRGRKRDRKRGLAVISPGAAAAVAFGRERVRPDALEALRSRLGAVS